MNKKFSTLVASLLLTSAFSVYSVDAKPMLATPRLRSKLAQLSLLRLRMLWKLQQE